jgi:leucyl-tRNA synthetase
LPAEHFALKNKQHPQTFNQTNIANFRRQLKSLGFAYDYRKEVDTTDPKFYE